VKSWEKVEACYVLHIIECPLHRNIFRKYYFSVLWLNEEIQLIYLTCWPTIRLAEEEKVAMKKMTEEKYLFLWNDINHIFYCSTTWRNRKLEMIKPAEEETDRENIEKACSEKPVLAGYLLCYQPSWHGLEKTEAIGAKTYKSVVTLVKPTALCGWPYKWLQISSDILTIWRSCYFWSSNREALNMQKYKWQSREICEIYEKLLNDCISVNCVRKAMRQWKKY